jgi:ABC-type Fe3+-hydroxamate transport system substrate-binding protein
MTIRCFTAWEYIRDIVRTIGAGDLLVGADLVCEVPESVQKVPVQSPIEVAGISPSLLVSLRVTPPTVIIAPVRQEEVSFAAISTRLKLEWGDDVVVVGYAPRDLSEVFSGIEAIGRAVGKLAEARGLVQRFKAQLMNWADNFYPRIKNKRVTFLTELEPVTVAGLWIPDLIRFASAIPQYNASGGPHAVISWADVVQFRPDVIIIAPIGRSLRAALELLPQLESQLDWDTIPAVKRGDVNFCDGTTHFYEPGLGLRDSAAVLFSAIAGFDSGYITPRGSFHRLRWVELNRHRLPE